LVPVAGVIVHEHVWLYATVISATPGDAGETAAATPFIGIEYVPKPRDTWPLTRAGMNRSETEKPVPGGRAFMNVAIAFAITVWVPVLQPGSG